MEMQQMMERLLAGQVKAEADRKTDKEEIVARLEANLRVDHSFLF